jgi:carboxylesterase
MTSEPTYPILPGAEPFSSPGGAQGALVVHGFTGSPQSMRGLAQAFAAAGYTVELPRLPGHGTAIEDMLTTSWPDWTAAVQAAYRELAARCDQVVVAGLSMGGTLTVWLALHEPEIAGLVLINPAMGTQETADTEAALRGALEAGMTIAPGVGGDIADPDATPELAYADVPLAPAVSLMAASLELTPRLHEITIPALLIHSIPDHVVPVSASEAVETGLGGPVEVVELQRSFHVATLDYDRAEIERRAVAFAARVFAAPAAI